MITFYDTASGENELPLKAISSAAWRVRFILNYKELPYKTVWLPYAKIRPTIQALGATPSGYLADGTARYTIPTIVDVDGTVVSDSIRIAEYLDNRYPERLVFPKGTQALQTFFAQNYDSMSGPAFAFAPLLFPRSLKYLEDVDRAYFDPLWSGMFGVTSLTSLWDTEDKRAVAWKNIEAGLDSLNRVYQRADGVFLGGETPLYADFMVLATLLSTRLLCAGEAWERIAQLNDRRWVRLLDAAEGWIRIQ
ncbi:hypothetical protein AURDEDRAFT_143158 [Auricularia subglabra TFB-10046 SS5]|nr:hypothetical protein AURDEDRAFT_143158 [Auricularia subglabra TFB-10046 SS5]